MLCMYGLYLLVCYIAWLVIISKSAIIKLLIIYVIIIIYIIQSITDFEICLIAIYIYINVNTGM